MRFIALLSLTFGFIQIFSQELPIGYITYFESSFSGSSLHEDILVSKQVDYSLNNGVLVVKEKQDTNNSFTPTSTILIDNNIFGDFITETRFRYRSIKSDSLSGIYFIAGLRDSTNYYFVRFDTSGVFFNQVYKGETSVIAFDSTLKLTEEKWINLNIKRDILKRTLNFQYNGSAVAFSDPNLVMGYVGFGVIGNELIVDNLNIWAPTSIQKKAAIFR